jgi:RNA polymerase sigma-70 factor (ECF subfamily)
MAMTTTEQRTRGHSGRMTGSTAVGAEGLVAPVSPGRETPVLPIAVSVPPPPDSAAEARGREALFRAMYEAHVDFVWRNLRRLGVSEAESDDKAQEVFVIAHRRFHEFEDRGHGPRAWLFQIVLRVASDARRHRRRHPEDPDGGVSLLREAVEAPQAEALARRESLWRLDAALEQIEVGRRAVLVLHEIEEMTAPEIAGILGIPLNTVYSRLRVARSELEAALAADEPEPRAARGRGGAP